ncbi:MAG: hypothetical protein U1A78_24380 [Polyangia bacterium]
MRASLRPFLLARLERLALRPGRIQRFMLASHRRALAELLPLLTAARGRPRRIAIVGGGLFPRSALLLAELVPGCELVLIDADAGHLRTAAACLEAHAPLPARLELRHGFFTPADFSRYADFDLVVVPLAFVGSSRILYARAGGAGPALLVHDWLWRPGGDASTVISPLLLKRLNLLLPPAARPDVPGAAAQAPEGSGHEPFDLGRAAAQLLPAAAPAAQPGLRAAGDALAPALAGAGRDPDLDAPRRPRPARL